MNKNSTTVGWLLIFVLFAALFILGQFFKILVVNPNLFVIGLIIVSFGVVMHFGESQKVNAEDMEDK